MTEIVEPVAHEFSANLLFSDLGPFFACDRQVKSGGGSQRGRFDALGEEWSVSLYYQESGLAAPTGGETPGGTPWQLDEMREFRIHVEATDEIGERKANFHVAPRWPGLHSEEGNEIPVPDGFGEGVNVRVSGSNIPFAEYLPLLQQAATAVGVGRRHFGEPHPMSNVQDGEQYVRVHETASGPIHARDGPIARMNHLLENDRSGYRKIVQDDTERAGFYHTATLGPSAIREAWPDHELPKEVKHYYAREPDALPEQHPLAHPKLGASYQSSLADASVRMPDEPDDPAAAWRATVEQVADELRETVLSVLADAGIQLHPGDEESGPGDRGPYVEDAYFPIDASERDIPESLDLAHVKHEQESVVIRYLADGGFSPVEQDALDHLISDGGQVSPTEIADENSRHVDSVRRALRRIDELIEREYGGVSLRSSYVAEMVHDAIDEATSAVNRAVEAGAKAVEAAERGLDERTSAFLAWAAKHGVDVDDRREASLSLRFGDGFDSKAEKIRAVKEGHRLWTAVGKDEQRYRQASVSFNGQPGHGQAWRWLKADTPG